jgi:protease II
MKYYKLMYDYERDNGGIFAVETDLCGLDRYDVERGSFFEQWNDNIAFVFDPDEGNITTDYLGNDLHWLIVSSKVKEMLEGMNVSGVQYLSITIFNKETGNELEGYYIANIYNLIEAFDFKNSTYDYFEVDENEKMLSVTRHVLLQEKISGIHVFRLKEDHLPIFVSEFVRDAIVFNKLTGFDFLEVRVV